MFYRHACFLILLSSITLLGCDGIPRLPGVDPSSLPAVSGDVVSQQGRGGYDWYFADGRFEIAVPSDLAVFDDIDVDRIRARIPPLTYTEPSVPFRPEGMEDETYHYFSRFTEPYFDTQPFLTIPFAPQGSGQFSVNAQGDRLALLNGNLEIWDLAQSKLLSKFSLDSSSPFRLAWSHDQSHVIVLDSNSITSVSVDSGKTTNRWQPPDSDSPMLLVHAGKTPTYAVSTKNGRLYVLDEQLRTTQTYGGNALRTPLVSISPDGKAVVGIVGNDLIQWNLQPTLRASIETLMTLDADQTVTGLIAGVHFISAIQPFGFFSLQIGEKTEPKQIPLNRMTHAVCMGTVDYSNEFFACCLSRRNAQGEQEFFLQNVFLSDRDVSVEFPLGSEPIIEMVASRDTNVFAVRNKQQIQVFKRHGWKVGEIAWIANDVARLVFDGEFGQAELLAREVSKMPRTRTAFGFVLYSYIADIIGGYWAGNENSDSSQLSDNEKEEKHKRLEILERWRETESELSILSSAYRHYTLAMQARGAGYASSVSSKSWNEFEKRLENARRELDPLLAQPNPTFGALGLSIKVRLSQGTSPEEQIPLIKQYLENYIVDNSIHTEICLHLLPRWGGNPGQAGSYLATAADLLPQPYSDILYAKVALRFFRWYDEAAFSAQEGGLSVSRVMRAIDKLIQERALWMHEAETLIDICNRHQRIDLITKLVVYCLDNNTLTPLLEANPERISPQLFENVHDKVLKQEREKLMRTIRGGP